MNLVELAARIKAAQTSRNYTLERLSRSADRQSRWLSAGSVEESLEMARVAA